jgi:hypothetical protein
MLKRVEAASKSLAKPDAAKRIVDEMTDSETPKGINP